MIDEIVNGCFSQYSTCNIFNHSLTQLKFLIKRNRCSFSKFVVNSIHYEKNSNYFSTIFLFF